MHGRNATYIADGSMSEMSILPNEVLLIIFSHLFLSGLYFGQGARATCKAMRAAHDDVYSRQSKLRLGPGPVENGYVDQFGHPWPAHPAETPVKVLRRFSAISRYGISDLTIM